MQMTTKTTTISYIGDRREVQALRLVAASRNTTIGKLVRDALFAQYGTEIASALDELAPFFAVNGAETHQMGEECVS